MELVENGEKRVRWRKPTEEDLDECLAIESRHMGDNFVGKDAAREVWRRMLGHPAFCGAVIECYVPGSAAPKHGLGLPRGTWRIVGFGASVFVSPEFADAELANPRPFVDARLIAAVHNGQPALLSSDAIARYNAGDGLNSLMTYGNCLESGKESGLTPEQDAEAQFILGSSFVELHAGYNLRTIFGEACGRQIAIMRRAGFAREAGTFPDVDRVFNVTTRADAATHPMSILANLFGYRRPVLQLSPAEQELLIAGLRGAPDSELAVVLQVSPAAVKARWRTIFARFSQIEPDALQSGDLSVRGTQKRHLVLAHVREHPEELRPFKPTTKTLKSVPHQKKRLRQVVPAE